MIKTVTLNAAIDKTVEIQDFQVGNVNRVANIRLDAGGKGINVSKVIRSLNGRSLASGVLAGRGGELIRSYLEELGIEHDFLFIPGEIRTNLKVVDPVRQTYTDINEPGVEIEPDDLHKLEERIFAGLDSDSILVLSGSVPAGVPGDQYRRWIMRAHECGAKTVLDADGELLRAGIQAAPYLVKPNIHELERWLGQTLGNVQDTVDAARNLFGEGVEVVVVSLGAGGAVFAQKDRVLYAEGLKVEVKSTVGAGDAMVAALCFAMERKYPLEEAAKLAMAASAAQVATPGTQPPEFETVQKYLGQVKVNFI